MEEEIWVEDEVGSSNPNSFTIRSSVSEIVEELDDHCRDKNLGTIQEESRSVGDQDYDDDSVYVAVGKSDSSMDALKWALKHCLKPSSAVFLIHVFPAVHHIPTPLGKLPKSQVRPEQLESYMNEERSKRRELLTKFLNFCTASQVRVDTILIESDFKAKAVLELIPVLSIKTLVIGTSKSSLRKGKRKGLADEIQRESPGFCDVKIICEGKDVSRQMTLMATTPTNMASPTSSLRTPTHDSEEEIHGRLDENEETVTPRTPKQGSHLGNKDGNKNSETDNSSSSCSCFFSRFT